MQKKAFFFLAGAALIASSISWSEDSAPIILRANADYENIISAAEFDETEYSFVTSEDFHIDNYEKNKDILENYIIGVVSAEMPVDFHDEALKAQAVAARTYCIKCVNNIGNIVPEKIYQSYYTDLQLKKRWGDKFEEYYGKIKKAVYDTEGIIMTYDGEAVTAVFHSMSGGMTESVENVWGGNLPYLVSAPSHEEEAAPDFVTTVEFSESDFKNKLSAIGINANLNDFCVTDRSEAGYVKEVRVGDKTVGGDKIRSIFSLRSTCFNYYTLDGKAVFEVKGFGHGVGMSQYGAEYMAISGAGYEEILKHYYKGVTLSRLR